MDRRWIPIIVLASLIMGVWNLAAYRVPQWMQAVVVQLGEPVRTVLQVYELNLRARQVHCCRQEI